MSFPIIGSAFHIQSFNQPTHSPQATQPVQPVQPALKPNDEPSRSSSNQQRYQSNSGNLTDLGKGNLP
jgi:hypothetical protein